MTIIVVKTGDGDMYFRRIVSRSKAIEMAVGQVLYSDVDSYSLEERQEVQRLVNGNLSRELWQFIISCGAISLGELQ